MKLASMLIGERISTVVVDAERLLCWPIDKSGIVAAIPDLTEGWIPKLDPAHAFKFTREPLLAPISARPHNIVCVGKNYRAHAKEFIAHDFARVCH
jgi:2-keto-4-pentenoate hydratase/2-oxohepta-3-ene-1,7-dioic acid hydratase in catechol pathway